MCDLFGFRKNVEIEVPTRYTNQIEVILKSCHDVRNHIKTQVRKKERNQKHEAYEWFLNRFCMHLWIDASTLLRQPTT